MDNPSPSSGQKQNQQQQRQQPQLNLNQKPQQTSQPQAVKPAAPQTSKNNTYKNNPSNVQQQSPVMQVAAAFVVGVLVGAIGYSLVNKNPTASTALNTESASSTIPLQNSSSITPATSATDEIVNTTAVTDNSVIVHNQPAGASVAISQVDLKNGGWVAIQEDTNGQPGVILGAAYFDAGQTLNGIVPLLRPTTASTSYLAVIHTDDGTKPRTFNYHTDTILNDSAGNPIDASFIAQ